MVTPAGRGALTMEEPRSLESNSDTPMLKSPPMIVSTSEDLVISSQKSASKSEFLFSTAVLSAPSLTSLFS